MNYKMMHRIEFQNFLSGIKRITYSDRFTFVSSDYTNHTERQKIIIDGNTAGYLSDIHFVYDQYYDINKKCTNQIIVLLLINKKVLMYVDYDNYASKNMARHCLAIDIYTPYNSENFIPNAIFKPIEMAARQEYVLLLCYEDWSDIILETAQKIAHKSTTDIIYYKHHVIEAITWWGDMLGVRHKIFDKFVSMKKMINIRGFKTVLPCLLGEYITSRTYRNVQLGEEDDKSKKVVLNIFLSLWTQMQPFEAWTLKNKEHAKVKLKPNIKIKAEEEDDGETFYKIETVNFDIDIVYRKPLILDLKTSNLSLLLNHNFFMLQWHLMPQLCNKIMPLLAMKYIRFFTVSVWQ